MGSRSDEPQPESATIPSEPDTLVQRAVALVAQSSLQGGELKAALTGVISACWPELPRWSTLTAPAVKEVETATVSAGVVLAFRDDGLQEDGPQALLAVAGGHYGSPASGESAQERPRYMIPGGFINLTCTPGSSLIPPSPAPEDPRAAAARETEEELRLPNGEPLLRIDPTRLTLMDARTLAFPSGEKRLVMGMLLELTAEEAAAARAHVEKMAMDPDYKSAAAGHSLNSASGKLEVSGVEIIPLRELAEGRRRLLHQDQASLFKIVYEHFTLK